MCTANEWIGPCSQVQFLKLKCCHFRKIAILLTLSIHAQRELWYLVCLSVCPSVDDYSSATGYNVAYEQYHQLQCYKRLKNLKQPRLSLRN